jgi:eukaryotic-like serine/threonine-protein kinase
MAQQEEPVQRKVALKIIKVGMDTKHVVARFEAERQALAMMDHPNIARILDGGATDTGRPYFVMELVRGVPITDYCDKNNLSLDERLSLFMPICRAIHSAHQKGIIHRDIKPSNVLVTLHHGDPMPKVIDLGIAKATNQKLTEKTLFTQYSHMIGTPAYMSPEQAEMSSINVDTRTDIYSLGVLLYELLTGSTPFSVNRLKELGYGEMQRVIAEEEPQMPSTRMKTMEANTKEAIAKKRSIDAQTLSKHFKGDIDWIVMKCLEKDRRRRYETPSELVADLNRSLRHEPVSAAAPSFAYQTQKLIRRHRGLFAASAAILAMFLIGTAAATWQAIRAAKAQYRTSKALYRAEEAQQLAEEMGEEAKRMLYGSLMDQARLVRQSRKPGFRAATESLLRKAAALETDAVDELEMRNEAIAAMFTPMSGNVVRVMEIPPERNSKNGRFNQPYDEGVILGEDGKLNLYHFDPKGIDSTSLTLDTEPVIGFGLSYSGRFLVTGHQAGRMRVWERMSTTE